MKFYFVLLLSVCFVGVAVADQPISEQEQKSRSGGLSPTDAMAQMVVADDLRLDQVLTEPTVKQPVFLNFDERGRMWVVQYIQYPHPAGLKIVSHDQYWRNVYDKVPPPPPNHFRGKDKITIHEDTNGDGEFDSHKTFVDGLNMATAVEHARDGHWVLNPPYLLFYPDKNHDDVPDGDPVVHLAGFGLEDSHSFANSLRWGPDGWLYGAQGSTVTANITRPGFDKPGTKPIYSQGQNIWRYHPKTRAYEIFAEGGGNAFGVEIDSVGRIYSGHNGGNTRGFHYPQGGYLRKGFTKHGPLSNPYAFGYFEGMPHHDVERFTHNFLIYDGGTLPADYLGKLFGVEPMQGRIVVSDVEPLGSSFQTTDLSRPVTSKDDWFRPVDIKHGPDGAVYFCDWYDGQVNHYRNHEGNIDPSNGRIYRLRADDNPRYKLGDLQQLSIDELVDLLAHRNRWVRQTALRVLAGHEERNSSIPALQAVLRDNAGQPALEAFWALYQISGIETATFKQALRHSNPHVRVWAVRLLGDQRDAGPHAPQLIAMAGSDTNVEVRQQLAATARRLITQNGLSIVGHLLTRDEDADDIYQPLMIWWALETHCRKNPDDVVELFSHQPELWSRKISLNTVLNRLMQRFAMEGTRRDLARCASLLAAAPDGASREALMKGFEEAFRGRAMPSLPDELVTQIAASGGGSLQLRVRQGNAEAVEELYDALRNKETKPDEQVAMIRLAGELALPKLPEIVMNEPTLIASDNTRIATLGALQNYRTPDIADWIVDAYSEMDRESQKLAQELLSSRVEWAKIMIAGVEDDKIDPLSLSIDVLRNCLLFDDAAVKADITERWGEIGGATTEEMKLEVSRLSELLNQRVGDVYNGQRLFRSNCGKCHKLFIDGGEIGPDLTTYKRDDIANMVLNVVNPNAEIREGFENYIVLTDEGRVITGLMVERDNKVVVLRTAEGQTVTIDRDTIEESRVLGRSLMPEGLLKTLSDEEITDLFSYLRSTQPLNN